MSFEQFPAPAPQEQVPPTMRVEAPPPSGTKNARSQEPRVAEVEALSQTEDPASDPGMMDTMRPAGKWAWDYEVSPSRKFELENTIPPQASSPETPEDPSQSVSEEARARHEGPTLRSPE